MAAICRNVADSVCEVLKFKADVGANYEDGKLPIHVLDLKVLIDKTNGNTVETG